MPNYNKKTSLLQSDQQHICEASISYETPKSVNLYRTSRCNSALVRPIEEEEEDDDDEEDEDGEDGEDEEDDKDDEDDKDAKEDDFFL